MKGSDGGWNGGVGGRDDTLLSMGLPEIGIARLEEDMRRSRRGVDRPSRPEMACTMIYLITGQQVSIVSHRDARNGTLETLLHLDLEMVVAAPPRNPIANIEQRSLKQRNKFKIL